MSIPREEYTKRLQQVVELELLLKGAVQRGGELLAERDRYRAALEAFLNPEKMGYAVTESVRDHVRGVLGIERVSRNA